MDRTWSFHLSICLIYPCILFLCQTYSCYSCYPKIHTYISRFSFLLSIIFICPSLFNVKAEAVIARYSNYTRTNRLWLSPKYHNNFINHIRLPKSLDQKPRSSTTKRHLQLRNSRTTSTFVLRPEARLTFLPVELIVSCAPSICHGTVIGNTTLAPTYNHIADLPTSRSSS